MPLARVRGDEVYLSAMDGQTQVQESWPSVSLPRATSPFARASPSLINDFRTGIYEGLRWLNHRRSFVALVRAESAYEAIGEARKLSVNYLPADPARRA